MNRLGKTSFILIGIGISVTITAAIIRILLRKDEEEENEEESVASKRTSLIVPVPKQHVGAVIGRGGSVIKEVQQKTNTQIHFDQSDDESVRLAVIRGQLEDVQEAGDLINKLIKEQPNLETKEIFIPVKACGRVIGKNGDTIRNICNVSKAKVKITSGPVERNFDELQQVIIKGTADQIAVAIGMIDEKIAEEEVASQKKALGVAGRSLPEKKMKLNLVQNVQNNLTVEPMIPTGSDGFLEVYVSAVENPGRFFVQIVGTQSIQLDKMVEEMTEFYSQSGNQVCYELPSVSIGDVVAGFYNHDKCWYRARVLAVKENSPGEISIEVMYVDFGDSGILPLNSVCRLKPEYMVIPIQAIECTLASVKPKDEQWSNEATDMFEKLTYAAHWQVIMAKPITPEDGGQKDYENSLKVVELIDTRENVDVNIAAELVKNGYAVWES